MKKIITTLLFISFYFSSSSQSVHSALNFFLSQDFFTEFEAIKEQAEESVKQFKYVQFKYDENQVKAVAKSYNDCVLSFNLVLENIKADLLNKEKRKYMVEFSEDYAKQVEADLYRAKEIYQSSYQRKIVETTNGQITGLGFLALLPELIGYAKTAFGVYKSMKKEMKKFNEQLLDRQIVDRYSFRTWEEIN